MKMKRVFKWLISILLIVGVLFVLCNMKYWKWSPVYPPGTWVNEIYVTGYTVDAANALLVSHYDAEELQLVDRHGMVHRLDFVACITDVSYEEELKQLLEELKSKEEGEDIHREFLPQLVVDQERLYFMLQELFSQAEEYEEASILRNEQGYYFDEGNSKVINYDVATRAIIDALSGLAQELDLYEAGCYQDKLISASEEKEYLLWEKLQELYSFSMIYHFGDAREEIGTRIISDWIRVDEDGEIMMDEDGEIMIDEDLIREYIAYLASKYDTFNTERNFVTHQGDIVVVERGTYGNQLDQETEFAFLQDAFAHLRSGEREPVYLQKALYQGEDDLGDTFIEIDLTNQVLYYHFDGEIVITTDIVSGNVSKGHKTPARVCYVYYMAKDRILRGADYASHVDYWMAVYGGIGIHDADWRSKFGGDIYLNNGSHGCINVPQEIMDEIYEMTTINTPVIMYYLPE